MNKMSATERSAYLAGVVEGLSYARYAKDKPDETGMNCINRWYFDGSKARAKKIHEWLTLHADKPVGLLMYVLIKQDCGV